jgi:hypothetical protein
MYVTELSNLSVPPNHHLTPPILFQAWLAGVIVELVGRQALNSREVDAIYDSLIDYMDNIDYPKGKRQKFLRFFWVSEASYGRAA